MKQWYLSREPNERRALLAGAIVVLALLLYGLGWQPLGAAVERQRQILAQQQETLQWMQGAAQQIGQLRASQRPAQAATANQPLLSIVENTARSITRAGGTLKRIEPRDQDSVQIWLDQAPFDEMIHWLNNLQRNSGIQAVNIAVDKQNKDGVVNARITLKRAGTGN